MSRYSWLIGSLFLVVSALSFAEQPAAADSRAMILAVDPVPLVAETSGGKRSFHIESRG